MNRLGPIRRTGRYLVLAALAFASPSAIPMGGPLPGRLAPEQAGEFRPDTPEALLVKSLLDIQRANLDSALQAIDTLLKNNPNFRLAQLVKGDLLMAKVKAISNLGDAPAAPPQRMNDFRDEARVRLQRYLDKPPTGTMVPSYLLQMDPQQKYAVVVDTSRSRLFLYRNQGGIPTYLTDYYITSGKNGAEKLKEGDQRTPVGVYFVTSSLTKDRLTDFYGPGAFPINYPNEWDKRLGRTGYGIWLHGTPSDTYSRPPRASSGCVVLPNPDLESLGRYLQVGITPVIISDSIDWVPPQSLEGERQALDRALEHWRRDWESMDLKRYFSHYAENFQADGVDLTQWEKQKQQANASKSWIKIHLSDISIFRYPGADNLAVVTFNQDYSSNNLQSRSRKRQYWLREGGGWKIVYEGTVPEVAITQRAGTDLPASGSGSSKG